MDLKDEIRSKTAEVNQYLAYIHLAEGLLEEARDELSALKDAQAYHNSQKSEY